MAKQTIENVEYAWVKLLDDHPEIEEQVAEKGQSSLLAKEVKKYWEPRLMTKHDCSSMVPEALKKRGLNVLPVSRYEYVLGSFDLFVEFPDMSKVPPKSMSLPNFDTLRSNDITSESNAINALLLSGILEDFLGEANVFETFNGRMGSGEFSFSVNTGESTAVDVNVHCAQIEIDGGFETDTSVIIMEAKNVIHEDFQVRQLYYPFRKYRELTSKPIRLVFSQYTNLVYYLYEYEFKDPNDCSSISLVRKAAYTLGYSKITVDDVISVWDSTEIRTDDNMEYAVVPFIQADKFNRITALMEHLSDEKDGLPKDELADFMETTKRQVDYYSNAGKYLGLFETDENSAVKLTQLGQDILEKDICGRRLALMAQMFEHEIFHRLFGEVCESGEVPERERVIEVMRELNVCNSGENDSMFKRRSSSVLGWLEWIVAAIDE